MSPTEGREVKEQVFRIANPRLPSHCTLMAALLHKSAEGRSPPFPQTDLADCHCYRYVKSGVTVKDSDTDLELGNLPLKAPRHQRLAKQFHTML